jgi:REP element-mobilizing transposase RayT
MPKRNRLKVYGSDQYYHLYNRGVNKQDIFREPDDYFYFLSLFKRYLSGEPFTDASGRPYVKLIDEVELVAFCMMPNHFHLLCYLKEPQGIMNLMHSVLTAYSMYFNKKYRRTGGLFEGPFLASRITNDGYLWHITRYIHLNPLDLGADFKHYPYSSISYFSGERHADWLHTNKLVTKPEERAQYIEFVADYETMHDDMKLLKNILAA